MDEIERQPDEGDLQYALEATNEIHAATGSTASAERFTHEDVAEVIAWWATSPDGYGSIDLLTVVRVKDGRFAFIDAWADTTGWGCQDGAVIRTATTLEELAVHGMTSEQCELLGVNRP